VLANWLFVTEIMMLLDQTVVERLIAGSSNLLDVNRLQLTQ